MSDKDSERRKLSKKLREQEGATLEDMIKIIENEKDSKILDSIMKYAPEGFKKESDKSLERAIKIINCFSPEEQKKTNPGSLFTQEKIQSIAKNTGLKIKKIKEFVENVESAQRRIKKHYESMKIVLFFGKKITKREKLVIQELEQINPNITLHKENFTCKDNSITDIFLINKKIIKLPENISNLHKLERLDISNNNLSELPKGLGGLGRLHSLNLSNNKILQIPNNFCNIENLENLDLSNNQLEALPACIDRLVKLKIINLKGNKITIEEISRLRKIMPNCNIIQ